MTIQAMEIIAPRGSMRLVAFPTFEEYGHLFLSRVHNWERMTKVERLDYYFKKRKRFLGQQCHCIKAFMKQHKDGRHRAN